MQRYLNGHLGVVLVLAGTLGPAQSSAKPNIVYINADNSGYGDLSWNGATKLHTPNIERLAAEERKCTDAHAVSAVCTPSRCALLTGSYPFRAKDGKSVSVPLSRDHRPIVDTARLTTAKVLKEEGCATACMGKWHLGIENETPSNWNARPEPGPSQLYDLEAGLSEAENLADERPGVVERVEQQPEALLRSERTRG